MDKFICTEGGSFLSDSGVDARLTNRALHTANIQHSASLNSSAPQNFQLVPDWRVRRQSTV